MVISTYQVNNVLRVYGNQLRQGKLTHRPKEGIAQIPDSVTISSEAKKNAIIEKISSSVLERVTQFEPGTSNDRSADLEVTVFERLKEKVGRQLSVDKSDTSGFIFKEISDDGESTHSLSIEDSKFLAHQLKTIIEETVDDTLI
jgi:hypothetical protein